MAPRKILVGTDFSEQAERAVAAAVELARRFSAELHLVHAVEIPVALFEPYGLGVPTDWIGEARARAQAQLEETRTKLAGDIEAVELHLEEVPAASGMADLATSLEVDWVVVGTHGRSGIPHLLLGSTAERTVREAPCDVLVVKGEGQPMAGNGPIVVGVDFSETSELAVKRAAELARATGSGLRLVHALDLGMPLVTAYDVSVPQAVIDEARQAARERLDALCVELGEGLDVAVEIARAPAPEALAEAAQAASADLLVTGSRGLGGLKRALLGSVAERVVRTAHCPVLTVKADS